MESSDLNSINDVETDRASFHLPTEEKTRETERHLAGSNKEFRINYPPDFTAHQLLTEEGQVTNADLYQCAMNERDYGSGSDSAEEEHSPFSSTEQLKYEGLATTGNRKETHVLRTHPSTPPDANDVTSIIYERTQMSQMNTANYISEQQQQEVGDTDTRNALVPTGSKHSDKQPYVMPRGEMETPCNDNATTREIAVSSNVRYSNGITFEDVDVRLATFYSHPIDWPHTKPSPEQMARAGMIYRGVFTIREEKIFDMVECFKCGKTIYGFTENDDPVEEHRKFYPDCH